MKERMSSPKSSNNVTRSCPEFKSSFQTCERIADVFSDWSAPLSLLPLLYKVISLDICPEDDDGSALVSLEWAIAVGSPCDRNGEGSVGIGPSVAIFFNGGCCSTSSAFLFRLTSWLAERKKCYHWVT